jgi:3-oxoadipate enol-lactonase
MAERLPLVFLHAFPLSSAMWEAQVATLRPERPVLAPDLPGFGGRPPGPADLAAFARAVLDDLDAARIRRCVLVGISMGGYVAFRILDRAPDRVAALVLADTRAGPDDDQARVRRTEQAARARREGVAWLPEAILPGLLGRTTHRTRPDLVTRVGDWIRAADPEGIARALEAMRDRPDSAPVLSRIRVPSLVLAGDEDVLTPPDEVRRIAAALPDTRVVVIPGAGHLAALEQPGAFTRPVGAFLDALDR